jgi:hypothetical protein
LKHKLGYKLKEFFQSNIHLKQINLEQISGVATQHDVHISKLQEDAFEDCYYRHHPITPPWPIFSPVLQEVNFVPH